MRSIQISYHSFSILLLILLVNNTEDLALCKYEQPVDKSAYAPGAFGGTEKVLHLASSIEKSSGFAVVHLVLIPVGHFGSRLVKVTL